MSVILLALRMCPEYWQLLFRLRQSEIDALTGSTEFSEFYERLRVIKDHHRKFPNEPAEPPELEFTKHRGEDGDEDEEEEDG